MKRALLILLCTCLSLGGVYAQICQDASVELTAIVQADPPVITLTWRPNANATQHIVYRKLKTATSWGAVIGNLPGDATQFVDTTVSLRTNYEYRVLRQAAAFSGYGYINAGIEIPAVLDRGIIILAADNTVTDSLGQEIARLVSDFEGDGWRVKWINVPRDGTAEETKNMIKAVYNENAAETKALFLFGHVRVPYSGELNPDGHPDHLGAWPADTYYGDMNGLWTDASVNSTVANDERNRNTPGDGKFDQSVIPNDIELQVGRVDFFNMPSFAASEIQLLRNYLNKNHAYRHKEFTSVDRAVIDDNFGYFGGEAFASTGWKNFAPLVGFQNVSAGDYFPALADSIHQWSYGCGGGWYQGAGGVGSTTDFANSNTKSVFTLLFGSYHGDWDTPDNFLRAPLAQGLTLANAWSGRPHWVLHHMGLGENIGYSTRLTMNNNNLYFPSYGARFIHLALMGDPTLRNDVVAPVKEMIVFPSVLGASMVITPPDEGVLGYNFYRRHESESAFTKLNDEPVLSTSFDDPCLYLDGVYTYMVRAVDLEHTPSGSYYNLSQGVFDTIHHIVIGEVHAAAEYEINGDDVQFGFQKGLQLITYAFWDFGDGQTSAEFFPLHQYDAVGEYTVTLIAGNDCFADTSTFVISILTSTSAINDDPAIRISPNPSAGKFALQLPASPASATRLQVISANGTRVKEQIISSQYTDIDLRELPAGLYNLLIETNDSMARKTVIIQK
jgi:hypothetical protein